MEKFRLNETTIVEVNDLHLLAEKEFIVNSFFVGKDFLVLKKKLTVDSFLELSVWAYGRGMRGNENADSIEILIGVRDRFGDIEMIEHEDFDTSLYSVNNLIMMVKELETKMLSFESEAVKQLVN